MKSQDTGKLVVIGAAGMMLGLIASDIGEIQAWEHVWTPHFIGSVCAHLSAVIAAAVGGRLSVSAKE
jgi:hypothetical protein